ncbi:hypothetical protein DFJ58DRAFT_847915 [Suillus subalutaceus]|uniref:uncharacterized protein n=1 Tax=Suillus subalutaceus TaxID=48586 RepID=UPI001B861157|nr:uncharacterized protein DFJ58DRAFT_847915 [Suillus subalutaceus]KAG1832889.1 hypothetical protein DFJ58DRAFT_847915 [Suillus subalutaceus]
MSFKPNLPDPDRILYASLVPRLQTFGDLESACRTWEDHLWVQNTILCKEKQITEMIKLDGGLGRSHLKTALSLSTLAGENHLRALLLAQVGAQYWHMAPAHAMEMLAVCETLGAGMGAKQTNVNGGKGLAKDSSIFKRANKPHRVAKQEVYNSMCRGAVEGREGEAAFCDGT